MDINLNEQFKIVLSNIDKNNKPNLFLHVCCGPCSTSVLKRISEFFNIYVIFTNSNIDTLDEFNLRFNEFLKVININEYNIKVIYNSYDHSEYLNEVKGLENEPEGGKRCEICFKYRLKKSYDIAKDYIIEHNLLKDKNYLCTTLSVSPHKNAKLIESIGENICNSEDLIKFLPSDFKKEDGYLQSIKLSNEYQLYRQNYCGCEFSKCIN